MLVWTLRAVCCRHRKPLHTEGRFFWYNLVLPIQSFELFSGSCLPLFIYSSSLLNFNERLFQIAYYSSQFQIDLEAGRVTTIIGTGRQGEDYAGGRLGIEQEISSPWDLALYKDNVLFIAMTGTHQIWAYAINEDAKFFNRQYV